IETPEERRLALLLLRYPETMKTAAASLEASRLCRFLYSVATEFSSFYSACPVLRAEDPSIRAARIRLVRLTRDVLRDGLGTLGIGAPERM
ncbi:MAG: arginine--tRNA ligase, partial [Planctomycetia bacterium]|nr:arginine--tRNA ligase [Planctomycetia bacterium]